MWKKYKSDILCLILIAIPIVFFFFPLFWPTQQLLVTPDFGRSDAWHFSFATKYLLSVFFKHNQLPLWTPLMGSGFPLLAEGQIGTFFLPNILLYKLFDTVLAYNLSLVLISLMYGWGVYLLLRSMALSRLASFFSGISLGLSGIVISQLTHVTLLQGFSLLPYIFLVTRLLVLKKTRVRFILLSFIISQQIFAGFPQATFISLLFASGYILWLNHSKLGVLINITTFALAIGAAAGISAIQLVPSYEFLSQITNPKGFQQLDASYYSFPFQHFLTLLFPYGLGNPKLGTYPVYNVTPGFIGSMFWENTGYIGIFPLIFAIMLGYMLIKRVRPISKRYSKNIIFFLVAGSIAVALMLGRYSPLYFVFSFWPFNLFRVPSRFLVVFILCLLVLSSYAVQIIMEIMKRSVIVKISIFSLAIVNVLILIHTWRPYHMIEPASEWLSPPETLKSVSRQDRIWTVGAFQSHNTYFFHGWKDSIPYTFFRNNLAPNENVFWNRTNGDTYSGRFLYRPYLITNSLTYDEITSNEHNASISAVGTKYLNLLSVSKLISTLSLTNTEYNQIQAVSNEKQTIRVYDNPSIHPRVYISRDIHLASTVEEAKLRIQDERFVVGVSVLLEHPINGIKSGQTGEATIASESDTDVEIRVQKNLTKSILILADTFYPGWLATIDGKPTTILSANILHRAIVLPPGNHIVSFSYKPKSFQLGMSVTISTVFLIILLMVFPVFFSVWRKGQKVRLPFSYRLRNHGTSLPHRA